MSVDIAPASAPPATGVRRRPRMILLIDAGLIGGMVSLLAVLTKLAWPRFTYWGDNAESFLPLWHHVGSELRSGRLPLFDHERWGSANLVGEAAYGVFNPVTLLNAVAVSYLDNLALASFMLMTQFLVLLAVGVYLLARVYGAARSAAIIAAIIVPFSGFTMFYEAGNWASGLMSITWVVHFWWTARAYTTGRLGPTAAIISGGLAATVGNPYSVLGILLVLLALAIELVLNRRPVRLLGLVAVGAVVGTAVLLVYLPLIGVLTQIDRPIGTVVANGNYLTPSLSDLLGLSSPGHLPRMRAWSGFSDLVPSTYLSWIVLPLLPWVRWSSFRQWRRRASVYAAGVLFLLLTLGPDQLWLFRWPIRLVEYLYVAIAVIIALILSSGLATNFRRRRIALSVAAVSATFFTAWSANPELWGFHLAASSLAAGLIAIAVSAAGKIGNRALLACCLVGTSIIAPAQALQFGWQYQQVGNDVDLSPPALISTVQEQSTEFEGSVLQVANIWDLAGSTAMLDGQIVFGNVRTAAGITGLNHYSGIGFPPFADTFAMDYRGSVGSTFRIDDLTRPIGDGYRTPLVDALGVSTLVIGRGMDGADRFASRLENWTIVDRTDHRIVLVREEPLPPTVITSGTIAAEVVEERGESIEIAVAPGPSGTLLIDRLAWNGYRATADGVPATVRTGPAGMLEIVVPEGTESITVDYEIPHLRIGVLLAGLGLLGGVVHSVLWHRSGPARRPEWAPEIDDERHVGSTYEI